MRTTLVTAPTVEPVTVDEAKAWLRLETSADDALVTDLITAARRACETLLSQSFITTAWLTTLDGFPFGGGYYNRITRQMGEGPGWLPQAGGGIIELDRPPLIAVQSIQYLDSTGNLTTLSPSIYRVTGTKPGRIQPVYGQTFPVPAPLIDAVQIHFTAGYGADASLVPATVKLGIKLLVAHYYEDREAIGTIPDGIAAVLSSDDHGHYG